MTTRVESPDFRPAFSLEEDKMPKWDAVSHSFSDVLTDSQMHRNPPASCQMLCV